MWMHTPPAIVQPAPEAVSKAKLLRGVSFLVAPPFFKSASASVAASVSFCTSAVNTASSTTYTFNSQSIGTAATGRRILVCAGSNSNFSGRTLTSITIDGVTATELVDIQSSRTSVGAAILQVDAGTTANIAVTWSSSQQNCGIVVFALYDLVSDTPTDSATFTTLNTTTDDLTLDTQTSGVLVAYRAVNASAVRTFTWSNVTEVVDQTIETNVTHTGACNATASGSTNLAVSSTASGAPTDTASFSLAFR